MKEGVETLVIGSKGFIGSNICKYLKEKDISFTGVQREDCDLLKVDQIKEFLDSYKHVSLNVIFCACVVRRKEDSHDSKRKNLKIVENFVEAVKPFDIASFVYLSSIDVYENIESILLETSTLNSLGNYGASKIECEKIVTKNFSDKILSILRLPGVYGENCKSQSVVGKFKHLVQSNEEVIISGEGSQLRDYLYVHDLPKAIHKIIYSSASGIFNLSSGKSLTIKKILNLISHYSKKQCIVKYKQERVKQVDINISNEKFLSQFPEFRFTSMEEGIKKITLG